MNQVKVNQTQKYSDSQGDHIVCEGKLMLLEYSYETHPNKVGEICKFMYGLNIAQREDIGYNVIKPIIISETEKIEVGDYVFNTKYPERGIDIVTQKLSASSHMYPQGQTPRFRFDTKNYGNFYGNEKMMVKILALPEHFSDKHLQAIVDGKMKDGDKVHLKVEKWNIGDGLGIAYKQPKQTIYKINLDRQNYITLFPAQQSLEEAAENYALENPAFAYGKESLLIRGFIAGAKWAKKNNY